MLIHSLLQIVWLPHRLHLFFGLNHIYFLLNISPDIYEQRDYLSNMIFNVILLLVCKDYRNFTPTVLGFVKFLVSVNQLLK